MRLPARNRSRTGAAATLGIVLALMDSAAAWASAPCASTEACLRAIEAAQLATGSIEADFVQVKHLSLLNDPLVSTGRLVFKRPDRILLQIDQPRPATILIRGREVRIPGLAERDRQALDMAPVAGVFAQLAAVFAGSMRGLQEDFSVTAGWVSDGGPGVRVELVPRRDAWSRVARSIGIRFGGADLQAEEISMEDAFGDRLEITLRNVRRNGDVPDSLFAK